MPTDSLGDNFRSALQQWGRDCAQIISSGLTLEVEEADARIREHFMNHGADGDEIEQFVIPTMRSALLSELMVIIQSMQINPPLVQ